MDKKETPSLLDTASLKTYINDENLNELPKEERGQKLKEESKPKDFQPFKNPAQLNRLKEETPPEDKN